MKAVVLYKTCTADELCVSEVPMPTACPGWVLIRVRAFGLNHSEVLLRQFEADAPYIHLPRIPGIECVGEVEDPSDTSFRRGQRVIALMGGMGRSFDGSYAEYTLVPARNVFAVGSELEWVELAAIPETFYTAYGSLLSLRLSPEDTLLVRGATSTVGLAAVQMAHGIGANVFASSRSAAKDDLLRRVGADEVVVDNGTLEDEVRKRLPQGINKVLELVGPSTLRKSLRLTARGGIVCHTGILGGEFSLNGFDPIKEIPNGVYLTGFYSNYPTQAEIDAMFALIAKAGIHPVIAKVFRLEEIAEAHRLAERGGSNGKLVVKVG